MANKNDPSKFGSRRLPDSTAWASDHYTYTGTGTTPRSYHQYRYGTAGPSKEQPCERPIHHFSIPLTLSGIPSGGYADLTTSGSRALQRYIEATPVSLIFCGSRDLWLSPDSHIDCWAVVDQAIPLDSCRPGSALKVSWPKISYDTRNFVLRIENRCTARNYPTGDFIARLECEGVLSY